MDPSHEHFSWRAPDDSHVVPFTPDRSAVVQLALNYDLCVTGEGLQHCCNAEIDDVVISCCQVRPAHHSTSPGASSHGQPGNTKTCE